MRIRYLTMALDQVVTHKAFTRPLVYPPSGVV